MSIAHRISELYTAKMNAVLDRACDPSELADYSYAQRVSSVPRRNRP